MQKDNLNNYIEVKKIMEGIKKKDFSKFRLFDDL